MKRYLLSLLGVFMCFAAWGDCDGTDCAVYLADDKMEQIACNGKSVGDRCTPIRGADANTGICINNKNDSGETAVSCSAQECRDGWALWFREKSYGRYTDPENGEKITNWGGCREISELELCKNKKKECVCDPNEECKFVSFANPIPGKGGLAYNGEAQCRCVAKKTQGDPVIQAEEKPCEYEFDAVIKCANGKTHKITDKIKIDKKYMDGKCREQEDALKTFTEWYIHARGTAIEWARDNCTKNDLRIIRLSDSGNNSGGDNDKAIEAYTVMRAFMRDVDAHQDDYANVWKTAEGKFNAARLASDLTAGVVLGTVGGVVSGVVIKKNQVKKGFESLHCTVGGQNVANWGDEFSVGLIR